MAVYFFKRYVFAFYIKACSKNVLIFCVESLEETMRYFKVIEQQQH